MPRYEFTRRGRIEEYTVSTDEIEKLTALLKEGGWQRIFTSPRITIVPGYQEAYEESIQEADKADAQAEKGKREGAVGIADALIEEYGH